MTAAQLIWLALIVALGVVNLPLALYLLKGSSMPLSSAFTSALSALVAAFTEKLAAKQTELDAANAQIAALQAAPAQVDAEATAAIIAATPAA
jgi:hypothetical protein